MLVARLLVNIAHFISHILHTKNCNYKIILQHWSICWWHWSCWGNRVHWIRCFGFLSIFLDNQNLLLKLLQGCVLPSMQQPINVSMNMTVKNHFHEAAFRSRQHWVTFYSYVLGLLVRSLERIKKCAKNWESALKA